MQTFEADRLKCNKPVGLYHYSRAAIILIALRLMKLKPTGFDILSRLAAVM